MLILSRKKGESIMINNNIEIIVSAIEGDHIKIGIRAPKEITVLRKEIFDEVSAINHESVQTRFSLEELRKLTDLT